MLAISSLYPLHLPFSWVLVLLVHRSSNRIGIKLARSRLQIQFQDEMGLCGESASPWLSMPDPPSAKCAQLTQAVEAVAIIMKPDTTPRGF